MLIRTTHKPYLYVERIYPSGLKLTTNRDYAIFFDDIGMIAKVSSVDGGKRKWIGTTNNRHGKNITK